MPRSILRGGLGRGSAPPPTPPGELTTFHFDNTEAVATRGLISGGHPVKYGDVPPGSRLALKRGGTSIAAQFSSRAYYPDGHLKFFVFYARDAAFAAEESREYTVIVEAGAFDDTSSVTIDTVIAETDFNVDFTNMSGSRTSAYANHTASFNDHAAVAAHVYKYASGPVADCFTLHGMAHAGGVAHAHLKVNWDDIRWKDETGALIDHEFIAEPAQDWFAVSGKERLRYDAALRDGSTEYAAFEDVQHLYMTSWGMCRQQDDYQHGQPHFRSGARPTLNYRPNQEYWRTSGLCPRADLSRTFTLPVYESVYVPGSSHSHRAAVDAPGGYMGRGEWAASDWDAFIKQTPAANRIARVNAWAGPHIPYGCRSEAPRVNPQNGLTGVANTVMSNIMWHEGGSAGTLSSWYDFQADGMPAPVHAYADNRSITAYKAGYVVPWTVWVGYIVGDVMTVTSTTVPAIAVGMEVLGGINNTVGNPPINAQPVDNTRITEVLSARTFRVNQSQPNVGSVALPCTFINGGGYQTTGHSGDTRWYWQTNGPAHGVNYSGYMYMLEGKRHFLRSVLKIATWVVHSMIGSPAYGIGPMLWYNVNSPAHPIYPGTPSTNWAAAWFRWVSNDRSHGWAMNNVTAAAAVAPWAEPEGKYITRLAEHGARGYKQAADLIPAGGVGTLLPYANAGNSPWMDYINGAYAYAAYDRTRFDGFLAIATYLAKEAAMPYSTGKMGLPDASYNRRSRLLGMTEWHATTNPWLDEPYLTTGGVAIATNGTMTLNPAASLFELPLPYTDGDRVIVSDAGTTGGTVTWPPELSLSVEYYIRDATATTFKLSLTEGGAAITFAAAHTNKTLGFKMQSHVISEPPVGMTYPADSRAGMCWMLAVAAFVHGHPEVPQEAIDAYEAYYGDTEMMTGTAWPTWAVAP